MPVSGDFLNRRFEKASFGGYKPSDVDSFMNELSEYLRSEERAKAELRRKVDDAQKKLADYRSEEDSLKNTLLNAQRLADNLVKDAQEKADLILKDANIKAENIIGSATKDIELRSGEAERIKKEVTAFKLNVMRLYKAQLELIRDIPSEEVPEQKADGVTAPAQAPQKTEVSAEIKTPVEIVPPAEIAAQVAPIVEEEPHDDPQSILQNNKEEQNAKSEKPADAQEPAKAEAVKITNISSIEVPKEPQEPQFDEEPAEIHKKQAFDFDKATNQSVPKRRTAMPMKPVESAKQERKPESETENQSAAATVKLNLRYNTKTGEYEPIGMNFSENKDKDGDGVKFGADYNMRTDSFDDGLWHHGRRK